MATIEARKPLSGLLIPCASEAELCVSVASLTALELAALVLSLELMASERLVTAPSIPAAPVSPLSPFSPLRLT